LARAHYPYEAWLVERKIPLVPLGLAKADTAKRRNLVTERKREKHDQLIADGQQPLF
jgi:hypothetical protein